MSYDEQTNVSVLSPIFPISNPSWLYVPLAHIVVPAFGSGGTYYYLQEDGVGRFVDESGLNLFIQE